jgi:uncharacterized protein (TIRG00374 family)
MTGNGFTRLHVDGKRLAILAGLGVLTVALLLALGDARSTWTALTGTNLRLLMLALLVHYSSFAVRGHRWQLLLAAAGHRLGYLYVTGVLISGWFVSALLPARTGDLFRVAVLRLPPGDQPVVPVADSLGSIVLERVLDIAAILVLSVGLGYLFLGSQAPRWLQATYLVTLGLLAAFGVALLLLPRTVAWLSRLSTHRLWQATMRFLAQLATSLAALWRRPTVAAATLGESLYIWLCDALVLWLVVASLGVTGIPFGSVAFVALAVDILAAAPLTPGGIGQVEAAYAALLALLPGATLPISAVVLVVRGVTYWSFVLFSGIVLFAAGFGRLLTGAADVMPARDEVGEAEGTAQADGAP